MLLDRPADSLAASTVDRTPELEQGHIILATALGAWNRHHVVPKPSMHELAEHNVAFGDQLETSWGVRTTFQLPGSGELGSYEPKHPMTIAAS